MQKCGLKPDISLRPYQSIIRDEIFDYLENDYQNIFISLPQGTGKTVIALSALSKLINEGIVEQALVILPSRELVSQWVEEVQKMFYGMSLVKHKPERGFVKTLRKLRYSPKAIGIAMTAHSFKSKTEKKELDENMFDAVLVDEAADIVTAKDFLEKYRLSSYIKGLEKWNVIKLFTQPHKVEEEKLDRMIKRFGEGTTKVIRKAKSEIPLEELDYDVKDTIPVVDPHAQYFIAVLDERRRKARRNIHRALDKLGIGGYRENVETLLNPTTAKRLQKKYNVPNEDLEDVQNTIRTYILTCHLNRWFLYSNRPEIERAILASQKDVELWLTTTDKKLQALAEEVRKHVKSGDKVYIFSRYIQTARQIEQFLSEELSLPSKRIFVITGEEGEDQFKLLEEFQRSGDVLIATPVFKRGTDIPSADVMFVFTPPFHREQLHQVVSRIRGGQLKFLAYEGAEKESVDNLVEYLQDEIGN